MRHLTPRRLLKCLAASQIVAQVGCAARKVEVAPAAPTPPGPCRPPEALGRASGPAGVLTTSGGGVRAWCAPVGDRQSGARNRRLEVEARATFSTRPSRHEVWGAAVPASLY
jgi:hypothetical protein